MRIPLDLGSQSGETWALGPAHSMEQIRNLEGTQGELGSAEDVLEGVALLGAIPGAMDDGLLTLLLGQRAEPEHEQRVEVAGERSGALDGPEN